MKTVTAKSYRTWFKENKETTINSALQADYQRRLTLPISKGGFPTFQGHYGQGRGNELEKKFWSKISSSRIAFELYSWIILEKDCTDFQFEKALPGIKSGNRQTKSYMDVYIKTASNEIWFIESKFTESPQKMKALPGSYYETLDEKGEMIDASIHSVTHYYKSRRSDGMTQSSLFTRYNGKEAVIKHFVPFCREMLALSNHYPHLNWFDAKQETCHLLGILMFMLDNPEAKNCRVHFRNIVYDKEGNGYISNESFATEFMQKAVIMVQKILNDYQRTDLSFDYKASTIQEVLNQYGAQKVAFGMNGKLVKDVVAANFPGLLAE